MHTFVRRNSLSTRGASDRLLVLHVQLGKLLAYRVLNRTPGLTVLHLLGQHLPLVLAEQPVLLLLRDVLFRQIADLAPRYV